MWLETQVYEFQALTPESEATSCFRPPVSVLLYGKIGKSSLVDVFGMPEKGLDSAVVLP